MTLRLPTCLAPAFLALLASLAGCGGNNYGADLAVRPKPQAIRSTDSIHIRIPQDEIFRIVLPKASRQPGLGGTAEVAATAFGDGTAKLEASVQQAGTADAQFQLGHAFTNQTDLQTDFAFTVKLQYEIAATQEPPVALPDAKVGLRLYARDNRGLLLRELPIADHSTENGPTQRTGEETLEFTLTLAPGTAVNVYVAGLAHAEIPEGRSAAGRVRLTGLQFDVTTRPAPPVRTAPNEPR